MYDFQFQLIWMWCMVYLQWGFSICTGSLSSDRSSSLARQVMLFLYKLFSTFSLKTFSKLIEVPSSNHSYVIIGKPLNSAGWDVDVLEQLNVRRSPTLTLFCPIIVGFFGCPKILKQKNDKTLKFFLKIFCLQKGGELRKLVLKIEILWAMLTKWYPLLPHVLYGKVLVLLWETPKSCG